MAPVLKHTVSVVVPTFNGVLFVADAVGSALAQTYPVHEIVVVDDGSTDETVDVVRQLCDGESRVRLVQQANSGVAAARNTGVRTATGTVIALLDQDDLWLPEKIASQMPLLADGVSIVGGRMTYLGPNGPLRATSGYIADSRQDQIASGTLMPFAPSSIIARRSDVMAVGGFDEAMAREVGPVDDLDFVSRMARIGRVVTAPTAVGYYRIHLGAGSFARHKDMAMGTRFVQAVRRAESSGTVAPIWADWRRERLVSRRDLRSQQSAFLYRHAGLLIASRNYISGFVLLGRAFGYSPSRAIRTLVRHLAPRH